MVTRLDVSREILEFQSVWDLALLLGIKVIGILSGTGPKWIRHLTFVASPFGSITFLLPTF